MKFPKSYEQAVCILLILGMQKDHTPLSSQFISQRLGISESYSKKIVRKLVKAQFIVGNTGNSGGLKLNRNLNEINLLDIYNCLEGESIFENTNLASKVFIMPEKIKERELILEKALKEIETSFFEQLSQFYLSEILYDEDYIHGYVDWKLVAVKENE